ncbi:DNA replication/repair protein RecF [Thioclava sp. GXIMD4216]|uniref:DNA replication/repair protein RecF n=1 Tax=Thioclava sp. GXIMD4216 TaxID=3131929 RepID=UPI0030D14652
MLSDLSLYQFRSHRRAVLTPDTRPVAIFGANGAGKTNILEAISLLSPGRGLRRAQAPDLMRRAEAVGWKVTAQLSGHDILTEAAPAQPRQVRVDGKLVPQTALGRLVRIQWLVPAMDRLWIEAPEGRRRFLDRITLSFFPDHAEASLAYEKAMRERNRLLKDGAGDAHWYQVLEARMAEAAADIRGARTAALARIAQAQDAAQTAFPAADLSITGDDVGDLPAYWAETRRRDMAAGRTLEGPHRADLQAIYSAKSMPADQVSTGEQKALLLSLVLANARAIEGATAIVLLDEVSAHLDPARRAALYDEICALKAQVFMTGTERALFDALGPRGQYLQVSEDAATSILEEVP